MIEQSEWLLIGAVAAVGVLHTIVPDHWLPITLIARQQGWRKEEVARAALVAGTGHTVSTLLIGLAVWVAGVAFATKFGTLVSIVSSGALIAFGLWIAVSSLREVRGGDGHSHGHGRSHHHGHGHEGDHGHDLPASHIEGIDVRDAHDGHSHHARDDRAAEASDALYLPSRAGTAVLTQHSHTHRHAGSNVHEHFHDHGPDTWHRDFEPGNAPEHAHGHKRSMRTTLLLILGSSPMVEGIPAFFAAGRYGPGLIAVMAVVFAIATIGTYVTLCVASAAGLQQLRFGSLERYGEVLSGAFIAIVGVVFLLFPIS